MKTMLSLFAPENLHIPPVNCYNSHVMPVQPAQVLREMLQDVLRRLEAREGS